MKRVLLISICTLFMSVIPVSADPVTIGSGVVAEVIIENNTMKIRNIQNTTGVDASDFHLVFMQNQITLAEFDFNVTETDPLFKMDSPVPGNGGFLMVNGMRKEIIINQQFGNIVAFWTDKGRVITPEPTAMLLLATGLAGVVIKTHKRTKTRKR